MKFVGSVCLGVAGFLFMCQVNAEDCSHGWQTFGDNCYQLRGIRTSTAKAWSVARYNCYLNGSELVSIHSPSEQQFVFGQLLQTNATNFAEIFIGLNSIATTGGYTWSDGSPMSYTHWKPGFVTEQGKDCIAVDTITGAWTDRSCDEPTAYVCKKRKDGAKQAPTSGPPVSGSLYCPSDWDQYGSYCYWFSSGSGVAYAGALKQCSKKGAALVSISSVFEQSFVLSKLQRDAWIGLNDLSDEGNYSWADQSAVVYTSWSTKEPNNLGGKENCVEMRLYNGLWNDNSCNKHQDFVCKMPARLSSPPTVSPHASSCPPEWVFYEKTGHCYLFHSSTAKTRNDSEAFCKSQTAHLVHIDDLYENAFLVSRFSLAGGNLSGVGHMWIGFNDMQTEGVYVWTDGQPVTFTAWRINEPNDFGHKEDCVELYVSPSDRLINGVWNDVSCSAKRGWICEKQSGNTTAAPVYHPTLSPRQCHDGWARFQDFCYRMEMLRLTWTAARDRCLQYGGDLISLHSFDEFNFTLTLSLQAHLKYSAFIGLNDRDTEGGYVWSDGSPVQYTHWAESQPNNFYSQQDCVEVFGDGSWNDVACGKMRHFGCKISIEKQVKPLPTMFAPTGSDGCDDGWVGYGQYCYLFSEANKGEVKSERFAQRTCRHSGGFLTSISSIVEQEFIASYLADRNSSFMTPMWIGLTDREKEGTFHWADDSSLAFTYWYPGEPDNTNCQEDCVVLVQGVYWNDIQCSSYLPYICKKPRNGMSPTAPHVPHVPLQGTCPPGWYSSVGSGYCYLANSTAMTWTAGEAFCVGAGGHLASIVKVAESTEISQRVLPKVGVSDYVWIGLNDRLNEHSYQWTDSLPAVLTSWNRYQPDDYNGMQNCVYMIVSTGRWHDFFCDAKLPVVCKTEKVSLFTSASVRGTSISSAATSSPGPRGVNHPTAGKISDSGGKGNGLSTGALAGIIAGVAMIAVIAVIVVVMVIVFRKRNASSAVYSHVNGREDTSPDDDDGNDDDVPPLELDSI